MAVLAGIIGVAIVAFALLTTRLAPTDAQIGIEVTCFVGGLVLIFLGVVLARLGRLVRMLNHEARGADGRDPPFMR